MEVPDMRKLPHDLRQATDRLGPFVGLYRRFD